MNLRSTLFSALLTTLAFLMPTVSEAQSATQPLQLGSPFVDDAILQRQMDVPVWGWAEPGQDIVVTFAGQTRKTTTGDDGKWMVTLDPMKASADGRELRVKATGQKPVVVQGVLVGEVWLSSGQSNMHWIAGKSMCRELAHKISRAEDDIPIREYEVDIGSSLFPQERTESERGWKRARHAGGFSALSLSFAHRLYEELGIPVGLLRSTHGATPVETWTPYEGFAAHPELQDIATKIRRSDPSTPEGKVAYEQFYKDLREWQAESAKIMNRGGKALPRPALPGIAAEWKGASRMYNKKINGLVPYAIRGMIWCQGTHNSRDGRIYAAKMEALVNGIRHEWKRPELPFYFTQMQCYGNPNPDTVGFADIREAQRLFFMKHIDDHVGMVVQTDLNSARPVGIHYFNKLHPGWRLARWALAHEYGREDLAYTGPLYKSHEINGDTVRVHFEQRGPGGKLMVGSKGMAKDYRKPGAYVEPAKPTPDDKLKHFRLADKDGKWHAADAVIEGMDVVVTSNAVDEPTGVQYAYSATPMGSNLYNEAGLPAAPFAYLNGKQLFQEDLRPPKQKSAPQKRERKPYLSIMTPFRNGAVVQRDMPAPIWGFAKSGATVSVQFAGQTKTAVVDKFDRWRVTLDPMTGNATGRDLVVSTDDGKSRTVSNVVVGDVWFFTGTTGLGGMVVDRRDKDATTPAPMPLVREFRIRTKARRFRTPRKRRMEIGGGRFSSRWVTAKPDEDGNMDITAAAYHFARKVQEWGVTVGIINMNAENPPLTWISYDGIQTADGFEKERDELNLQYPNTESCKRAVKKYINTVRNYCDKITKLRDQGKTIPGELAERAPAFPQPYYNQWSNYTETPTHTYNFCLAPNTPLAVKGVVWIPGPKNIGEKPSRYAAALEAYAESLPGTYGQDRVSFSYAQPAAELLRRESDGKNDAIRKPNIPNAVSIEFDQWPKDLSGIAARLGARIAEDE